MTTYGYGDVEDALLRVFELPEWGRAAMAARIKYARRAGVSEITSRKGAKIVYDLREASLWALALEMTNLGMPPTVIHTMIPVWRGPVLDAMVRAVEDGGPAYLMARTNGLSAERRFSPLEGEGWILARPRIDPTVIGTILVDVGDLARRLSAALGRDMDPGPSGPAVRAV